MDFLTVTYAPELNWLELQARSFARFLDRDEPHRIFVVVNQADFAGFEARFEAQVRPSYGALRDGVHLVPRGDLLALPEATHGWRSQQALKLAGVRQLCGAGPAVVLDTKNHFVRPVGRSAFQDADGRLRSWRQQHRGHMQKWFVPSLRRLGLDPERHIDAFLPTITPFPLRPGDVRDLLERMEALAGPDYLRAEFARADCMCTEFFLLGASIVERFGALDAVYVFAEPASVILFPDKLEDDNRFGSIMFQAAKPTTLSFALHHASLPRLAPRHRAAVRQFWLDAGLVFDDEDASRFFALAQD